MQKADQSCPSGKAGAPKKPCTHLAPASEIASVHAEHLYMGAELEQLLPLVPAILLLEGSSSPLREVVPRADPQRPRYLLHLALLI